MSPYSKTWYIELYTQNTGPTYLLQEIMLTGFTFNSDYSKLTFEKIGALINISINTWVQFKHIFPVEYQIIVDW